MRMMILRPALAMLFALGFTAMAQERPTCSSVTRGMIWPQGPLNSERSRRCEEVSQCARGMFTYRWQVVRLPYWKYLRATAPESCRSDAGGSQAAADARSEDGRGS